MRKILTLGVALAFLAFAACGDDDSPGNNTTDNCTDADGDTYGVGTDCTGPDCNDNDAACWLVGDACCDATPDCTDADGDGYGVGMDCTGADCDDADNMCWEGACCTAVDCTDLDQDGYGDGMDCLGADCDDSNPQCWVGACCPAANCVDMDQDGYGSGTDCLGPDCNDNDVTCYTPGDTCCPEPGDGNAGEACTDASQCTNITAGTPECMTDIMGFVQFPGGYCTGNGCTEGSPCDNGGGVCMNVYIGNYCLKPCATIADCRQAEGYDCAAMPGGQPGDPTYCLPPMGGP